MSEQRKDNCETCRMWRVVREGDYGQCRRHAPTPEVEAYIDDEPKQWSRWPITVSSEWCGEFEARALRDAK